MFGDLIDKEDLDLRVRIVGLMFQYQILAELFQGINKGFGIVAGLGDKGHGATVAMDPFAVDELHHLAAILASPVTVHALFYQG